MNEFFVSITVGFLCTLTLFALCFLIVLGTKVVYLTILRYLKSPPIPKEKLKRTAKKPAKPKPQPNLVPVRSIEIDPYEIDRIYVKKSS